MPKELARVVASYKDISSRAEPLLKELASHERDYVIVRDRLILLMDDLVEELTKLGVKTAADPKAANNSVVKGLVRETGKYLALVTDRDKLFSATVKKVDAVRADLAKLQKDVLAVTKAKSGFFSTSKSLPKLKALSVTLGQFADELKTATSTTP
jgi:hypothetical protein